jgi:hypothetical protein
VHALPWGAAALGAALVAASMAQAAPAKAAPPKSASGLVYVADPGGQPFPSVFVYDLSEVLANANPKPRKQIAGFQFPTAVAVDQSGGFYVADQYANIVYYFRAGAIQPERRYSKGINAPVDVAIGNDGTLYVANSGPASSGTVVEFAPGSRKPTRTLSGFSGSSPNCIHLDAQNNLYVGYGTGNGTGAVNEYAPGASSGTNLGLQNVPTPLGIAIDASGTILVSGYTILGNSYIGLIQSYIYGQTRSVTLTSMPVFTGKMVLDQNEDALLVADGAAVATFAFLYPSGQAHSIVHEIDGEDPAGIAVYPADAL